MGAEFKVGDRVKVTQEGVVTKVWAEFDPTDEGISVTLAGEETTFGHGLVESGRVTFEKVEPPVEVFKPGDVVRSKSHGHLFVVGENDYYSITAHRHVKGKGYFTSEGYERVDLG